MLPLVVFFCSCVDVIQDLCVFVCQNRSQSVGKLKLDSLQFQHFRAGGIAEILFSLRIFGVAFSVKLIFLLS